MSRDQRKGPELIRKFTLKYVQLEERMANLVSRLVNIFSYKQQRQIKESFLYALLGIALLFIVFPMFWMFSTAFRPPNEIFSTDAPLLPNTWTLEQFTDLLLHTNFLRYYFNSIIVSLGVVLLTVTFATLGGYGLTRIDIRFKKTFARMILFGYMFPAILLAIPMFIFWREIGLVNTYTGLILAETAIALPFSLWLMWKFFQTVPISLEESAQMAGASRFRAFYEIALPMAKPGMVAVGVFAYAISWNAFTLPLIIMPDSSMWPLTIGIHSLVDQNHVQWGLVMAASALTIIPSFLFVYLLQKYLLRGFRA